MKFLDEAKIFIRSATAERLRGVPAAKNSLNSAAPSGGDGGKAADVIERRSRASTRSSIPLPAAFQGKDAAAAWARTPWRQRGRCGAQVPAGTQIYEEDGGLAGRSRQRSGRARRSPRRQWRLRQRIQVRDQTARRATPIRVSPGGTHHRLRLKLIADAGNRRLAQCRQIHLPGGRERRQAENRRLSVHHPQPQLGVVRIDGREFVLAIFRPDRGRHLGAGRRRPLPRHVERCACCCMSWMEPRSTPGCLQNRAAELEAYEHGLTDKPEIVVLNKADSFRRTRSSAGRSLEARRQIIAAGGFGSDRRGGAGVLRASWPSSIRRASRAIRAPASRPRPGSHEAPVLADFRRIVSEGRSSLLIDAAAGTGEGEWSLRSPGHRRLHAGKRDVLGVFIRAIALRSVLRLPPGCSSSEDSQAAAASANRARPHLAEILSRHAITADKYW